MLTYAQAEMLAKADELLGMACALISPAPGAQFTCFSGTKVLALLAQKY
jgi:hypothetical protein